MFWLLSLFSAFVGTAAILVPFVCCWLLLYICVPTIVTPITLTREEKSNGDLIPCSSESENKQEERPR